MLKQLLKTMVAVLAIAATAAGPVRGQTTYNVTFGGFSYPALNTTVNVASLPQTFTSNFNPPSVINDVCYGFTNAYVTSGGEGNVSASVVTFTEMSITVSGTFEGTATIHVTGKDDEERDISTDITVSCVAAPEPPTPGQNSNVSWVLTPYGQLQTGDTVVIVDKNSERALPYNYGTSDAPSAVAIEMSGDQNALTEEPAATLQWVVVLNNGNYQFKVPGSSIYLYCEDANNGVRVGDNGANQFTFWTGGPNDATFLKNTSNSRYIGVYVNSGTPQDWRCYTSTSINIGNTVTGFYKKTVTAPAAPPQPHTVRFASGNDGWSVTDVDSARSATAPAVLQNVMAGDSLVVTAPATLPGKVKSVKAVKYVAPAATVTTDPTATAAIIEANTTTALVNAGAANGGTMMYAVTTTNAQPASTADFSATRPTAEGRAAGTYYVWYYAKADADHSDSEIAGPVSVTLAVMTTVTWSSTNVFNSDHQNDKINAWQSGSCTFEGITISKSGEYLSSFEAYNSDQKGSLSCFGEDGDSYTFTAPSGKKFCKIVIIDNWGIGFDDYGDWTLDVVNNNIVWSGTAANAVTLGTVFASASNLNSIVFTLIDAQ